VPGTGIRVYASSGTSSGRRGFVVRHWKLEIKNRKIHSKLSNEVMIRIHSKLSNEVMILKKISDIDNFLSMLAQ